MSLHNFPSARLRTLALLALLSLPASAVAQEPQPFVRAPAPQPQPLVLPQHPQPQTHRFWDRPNVLLISVSAGLHAADAANSCHALSNGFRERWLPASCAGVSGFIAADFAGETLVSYFFHRRKHHKLERLVHLNALGNAFGLAHSLSQN